jgi:hypothetical protein
VKHDYVNTLERQNPWANPKQYCYVHYLVKRGLLQQIELSERKRYYVRASVVKMAADRARFEKRAA